MGYAIGWSFSVENCFLSVDKDYIWQKVFMQRTNLKIDRVTEAYPYDLLLLADETIEAIHQYLFDSEVYIARKADREDPIGVLCLYRLDAHTVEVKNIAVSEACQGNGIGCSLIAYVTDLARRKGYENLIVGTGDCGFRQIRFYEKNGFVRYGVKKNFFLDKYDFPIYENGVQLKDMVMLKKELVPSIQRGVTEDYEQLAQVWESSVKATHHFLSPEDFEFYKKSLPDFFSQVELYVIRSGAEIMAFMGIAGKSLEMLFVSDQERGKGYGKRLLEYAVVRLRIVRVDVNEQNSQALGFYEKFGFKTVGRSEKDASGKDYPVLHLSL